MWTNTHAVPRATAADTALAYLLGSGDRSAIASACEQLGLELTGFVREVDGDDARPELRRALDRVAQGGAGCLVVRRLADLSRGSGGLAAVLDRIDAENLRVIALDVGIDTAAPTGRMALARHPRPDLPWTTEAEAEPADAAVVEEDLPQPAISAVPDLEPEPDAAAAEIPEPEPDPAPDPPTEPLPDPAPQPPPILRAAPQRPATVPTIGYASAAGLTDGAAPEALAAQRRAIAARCAEGGFALLELVGDRDPEATGAALDRPGLSRALRRIAAREASCLVVSGLDRLSDSDAELGQIVRWLERHRIRLVALDLDLDTATEAGRTAARALASAGGWERERLSERPRPGPAAARAERPAGTGARAAELGDLHERIAAMRADGMTLQRIADVLNAEGVPTVRGGAQWRASSVQTAAGYRRPTRARAVDRQARPRPRSEP